jgi:hypothetical protein
MCYHYIYYNWQVGAHHQGFFGSIPPQHCNTATPQKIHCNTATLPKMHCNTATPQHGGNMAKPQHCKQHHNTATTLQHHKTATPQHHNTAMPLSPALCYQPPHVWLQSVGSQVQLCSTGPMFNFVLATDIRKSADEAWSSSWVTMQSWSMSSLFVWICPPWIYQMGSSVPLYLPVFKKPILL